MQDPSNIPPAIVAHGGTISHQHGVGVDHAPYLEAEKGPLGLDLIRAVGDLDVLVQDGVTHDGVPADPRVVHDHRPLHPGPAVHPHPR